MIGMIIGLLLGIGFAFFALQNNAGVFLQLTPALSYQLPLFAVIFLSFIIGVVVSLLLTLPSGIASFFALRRRDSAITEARRHEQDLSKKVRELEVENARLRKENRPSILPGAPRHAV